VAVECPSCASDEIDLVEISKDGRRHLRCVSCGHDWLRGEAQRVYKTPDSIASLRGRFPSADEVSSQIGEQVAALKQAYLADHPNGDLRAIGFVEKYQRLFSREGLAGASPGDLKYFGNANVAGNPGNMSVFNNAWNELGPQEAASRVKEAIEYLLYGPDHIYLEDRLTHLIQGRRGLGMIGFREALLTKVLCMVEPDRFLPINKYTGQAGKREIAKWIYGLDLPAPEAVSWTIGRLIIWSNDLLLDLVGEGFSSTEHAAGFLWWAKDQARGRRAELADGGSGVGPKSHS